MKTILITGIGGDIAQSIATIIRGEHSKVQLIGVDMDLKHAGYLFVDKFFQVPSATKKNYLDSIREIITSHSVDLVIPTNEKELSVFSPIIDELGENRCTTVGLNVINIGLDKLKTNDFIASLGYPVPWTVIAKKNVTLKFPCIFKAQTGSGSKNIFNVVNQEEATFLIKKFPNSIFQELLEPEEQEVTCAVYRSRDGRVAVLQLLRKLIGGLTGWCSVINNGEVLEICKTVAKNIDLQGSMNIQLRITKSGPRIFEINPRFSSTVLMRHRLGFCDLLWTLSEARGLPVNFPTIKTGQCMVRVQDAKKLIN